MCSLLFECYLPTGNEAAQAPFVLMARGAHATPLDSQVRYKQTDRTHTPPTEVDHHLTRHSENRPDVTKGPFKSHRK